MSLKAEDRNILIRREFQKAVDTMQEAKYCANGNLWNVVGNRLYYSIFHAVAALLIHKEVAIRSHKGALRMFSLHYVREGIFSSDDQALYSRLQTIREKADYQNTYNLSSKEGTEYLKIAEEFLNKIETYLIDANRIENNPNNGKDREGEA